MNNPKTAWLLHLLQGAGGETVQGMPDFPPEMPPWNVIISMRDKLPPHEQRVVDLMVKLDEVKDLLDEIQCAQI
ncbi:MAG: hypothetical protein FWC89_07695 [Defluviitaleaceae bacterium]|nr:hypothetical protein [Defluviitaleaceae bacterium]